MYSGHFLLYGLFFDNIDDVCEIFNIEYSNDIYYIIKTINDELKTHIYNCLFEMYTLPCCLESKDEIFLAVKIGQLESQYRKSIETYKNYNEYYNEYFTKLQDSKKYFNDNKKIIKNQLRNIMKIFPNMKKYKKINNCEFYTIPNDCDRCT